MSRSYRKTPIIKDKDRWFQKYYNRKERRLAKELIKKRRFAGLERKLVPMGNYDICDYWFGFWSKLPENPRERHKLLSK